jgi:hypothetical protein
MAIVELHGTSNAMPAQLYDGGDLGMSDCKKMKLSYLSWASTGSCIDIPNYVDSDGETCGTWEEYPTWCIGSPEDGVLDLPASYAVDRVDPSQACCVCGGGNSSAADFSPQMTTVQLTDHEACQVRGCTPFMSHECDGDVVLLRRSTNQQEVLTSC